MVKVRLSPCIRFAIKLTDQVAGRSLRHIVIHARDIRVDFLGNRQVIINRRSAAHGLGIGIVQLLVSRSLQPVCLQQIYLILKLFQFGIAHIRQGLQRVDHRHLILGIDQRTEIAEIGRSSDAIEGNQIVLVLSQHGRHIDMHRLHLSNRVFEQNQLCIG